MPDDFTVERRGERLLGYARGTDRRHVDRLRRGEIEVELELDLHGLRADEARRAVRDALREAHAEGARCLLVIHGRGHGSAAAGPVLRERLVEWLTAPPVGRLVMAFATAQPAEGGAGATCVLLRRRRASRDGGSILPG